MTSRRPKRATGAPEAPFENRPAPPRTASPATWPARALPLRDVGYVLGPGSSSTTTGRWSLACRVASSSTHWTWCTQTGVR